MTAQKPDLDTKPHIQQFVEAFYGKLLNDKHLAPIFLDVAAVDLNKHLPLICSYWEKLLLGERDYNRHTMNIHRALNAKQALTQQDFDRWLQLFITTVDQHFSGPKAEQAKRTASQIAANMFNAVSG
ncbi:group III truncated hemoglobin [Oceanicoccus sp. KOV_DT_Chl]|uniref:group III truncated hemoglobin n=1 Tax=Oceanicoccus sp. KOV_DT_Chl TaxID=1904639 RepID=UPI000C7AE36C|nr:group III truncated hemoglobin [Oceanicoccus sp. KOV_DT_Chl]